MTPAVVTVTKVQTPWYGFAPVLRYGFRKAVPEYQRIAGLQFKYFATTEHGRQFGGIYLWDSRAAAERQFSPQWHERVQRTYHVAGQVSYYPLLETREFVAPGFDYPSAGRRSVCVFLHGPDAAAQARAAAGPAGLLRLYRVQEGSEPALLLLFASPKAAEAFLATKGVGRPEMFETPVLLKNG